MPVLVTAATRHQATGEIAEAIAEGLRDRGIHAEALPIEEVTSIEGYAAAVLGSAVYAGRWLGSARELVVANVSALLAMPVWLFSSGPVGPPAHLIPPGEPADAPVMVRLTRARAHRVFAGRLDRQRLDLEERSSSHIVHAPDADYRDWSAIDAFAGEIAAGLLPRGLVNSGRSSVSDRSLAQEHDQGQRRSGQHRASAQERSRSAEVVAHSARHGQRRAHGAVADNY